MNLDGLTPAEQRAVQLVIDDLVALYPDAPRLREEAANPPAELMSALAFLPPLARALFHLGYVAGFHGLHRDQAELHATVAQLLALGVPWPEVRRLLSRADNGPPADRAAAPEDPAP
jgi:hypothetical protein